MFSLCVLACIVPPAPFIEIMVAGRFLALVVVALGLSAYAAPAPITEALKKRQSITTLSSSAIAAFTPYSYYASTGYCTPATTLAWNCGGILVHDSG